MPSDVKKHHLRKRDIVIIYGVAAIAMLFAIVVLPIWWALHKVGIAEDPLD